MHDIDLEKPVEKHRTYFHITAVEKIDSVRKNGIKANEDGQIFVFTSMIVSEAIATNQLGFVDEFAVFRIDSKGITGEVIMDLDAEFEAPYQRIIIQEKISKRHIEFIGSFIINPNEPTEWELLKLRELEGWTKAEAKRVFYERRKQVVNATKKKT
jgi:hypothetical protein